MNAKRLSAGFVAAIVAMLILPTLSAPMLAAVQAGVTSADIQRLQDEVYQTSTDVSRLRTSDALQAGRLQDELDNLREDVIYLKVKLRKKTTSADPSTRRCATSCRNCVPALAATRAAPRNGFAVG